MLPNKPSDRLQQMHWILAAALGLFAAVYQIGAEPYVYEHFGERAHYGMEVFIYGAMPSYCHMVCAWRLIFLTVLLVSYVRQLMKGTNLHERQGFVT